MSGARRLAPLAATPVLPGMLVAARRHRRLVAGTGTAGAVLGLDPDDPRHRVHVVERRRGIPLLVGPAVLAMSTFTSVGKLWNAQRRRKELDKSNTPAPNKPKPPRDPLHTLTAEAHQEQA